MNQAETSNTSTRNDPSPDGRVCPICGGRVEEIHCIARCARCHAVIDTCCEGAPPAKTQLADALPGTESPTKTPADE